MFKLRNGGLLEFFVDSLFLFGALRNIMSYIFIIRTFKIFIDKVFLSITPSIKDLYAFYIGNRPSFPVSSI